MASDVERVIFPGTGTLDDEMPVIKHGRHDGVVNQLASSQNGATAVGR